MVTKKLVVVNYRLYNRYITKEFNTVAEAVRFMTIRVENELYSEWKLECVEVVL